MSLEIIRVAGHIRKGKYVSSHVHLNLTYLFEVDENEELQIQEEENSGVAWFDINELKNVVNFETDKWVLKNVYYKLNEKIFNNKE